jgi:outer membrane protein assembly factor BamB
MRLPWAAWIVLATLLLASCSHAADPPDPAQPWKMYQRSADHNAVVDRAAFTRNWTLDSGGQINGGIAISGNIMYVDTLEGDLLAIDLRDGHIVWRAHAPHALMSTPIVSGGLVYVGSGTAQVPDNLTDSWGKRDIVMGVREGDAMYAYDSASGALKWSYATKGHDMASPAISGTTLIFANGDFHAYGLDASTGRLLWKRPLPGLATMASTTLGSGRAFVSTCRYLFPYRCATFALDPTSGRVLWRAPYGNADSSPTFANGTVFVSGLDYAQQGRQNWRSLQRAYAVVAALDAKSGKLKWLYRDSQPGLPSDVGTAERAIAGTYANGKYFQPLPGRSVLLAFNATKGSVLWEFDPIGPIKMSPLYYRNRLYAGENAGVFYTLNASTGQLLKLQTFRHPFGPSPPVLIGNTMVIAEGRFIRAIPLSALEEQQ